MSIKSADALTLKLQQGVFNELETTDHLLHLISQELQQIKQLTQYGGEFETNVLKNTELVKILAAMHQLDFETIPPFIRMQLQHQPNQNNFNEERDIFGNSSTMEVDKVIPTV